MDISEGLYIYLIVLGVLFLMFYAAYFYMTIAEGYRRDFGLPFLILFSLFGSPFMAYGFVKSAKKDSDRVKARIKGDDGTPKETTLSHIIDQRIPRTNIESLDDINQSCRFCNAPLADSETNCPQCHKRRMYFSLGVQPHARPRVEEIPFQKWTELPAKATITEVIRSNTPRH